MSNRRSPTWKPGSVPSTLTLSGGGLTCTDTDVAKNTNPAITTNSRNIDSITPVTIRRRLDGEGDPLPPLPFAKGGGVGGGPPGGSTVGTTTSTSTMNVMLVAPASYRRVALDMRKTSPCCNQQDSVNS
jgi:hypothetical protein